MQEISNEPLESLRAQRYYPVDAAVYFTYSTPPIDQSMWIERFEDGGLTKLLEDFGKPTFSDAMVGSHIRIFGTKACAHSVRAEVGL